jgi:hypothetical protein
MQFAKEPCQHHQSASLAVHSESKPRCTCAESQQFSAYAPRDTTVSCILTRFRLRSSLSLIPFYFAFVRVRRDARKVAGLLKTVFLVEDLHTCYTLSIWKNDKAISQFGSLRSHVEVANYAFSQISIRSNRPEIWSAQFKLWAVSRTNLHWEGLDPDVFEGRSDAERASIPKE